MGATGYWHLASWHVACMVRVQPPGPGPDLPGQPVTRYVNPGRVGASGQRAARRRSPHRPPPTGPCLDPLPLPQLITKSPSPRALPRDKRQARTAPIPGRGLQLVAHHTAVPSPMEVLVAAPALARLRERQWGGCWQVVVSRRLFDSMAPSVSQAGMQGPCAPPLSHLHRLTSRRGIRTGHSKRLAVGSPGTKVQSNGLGDNTTELTNWSGGKRLRGCSLAHWRCRRCGCNAPCPCRWTGWMQREARSSCTS
jgi:hypothetical protein